MSAQSLHREPTDSLIHVNPTDSAHIVFLFCMYDCKMRKCNDSIDTFFYTFL